MGKRAMFEQSSKFQDYKDVSNFDGQQGDLHCDKHTMTTINLAMLLCELERQNPCGEIRKPLTSTRLHDALNNHEIADKATALPNEALFEIILLANEFDIKWLLDVTCAAVACKIKGRTTEEIRKEFHIVNDFTPEEEMQIREDN